MGMMHLVNCKHMKQVELVAAADPRKKVLNKAEVLGVKHAYTDYTDLIAKEHNNLDAVVISVPNFLHFDPIRLSLENGLNVFSEKPLAADVEQCKEIVHLVQASGRKFMLGHNMRFVPAVQTMKADLSTGRIGNLEVATIEEILNGPFSHPRVPAPVADWWFDPQKSGGGALMDLGYHMIDLFRFFTEEDANVLFADFSYKYNLPIEEGATIILSSTKSSIRGIINVGWYQRSVFPKYNFRVILHGDANFLSTEELVPRKIYNYAAKEVAKNLLRRITGRKIQPLTYTYYWEAYYKEFAAFFESIEKDTEPPVTAMDGLKTVQIIQDAYALFKENRRRSLHEE
jgi:UDP-N-acetylglucosamine 3-dehydrogenase